MFTFNWIGIRFDCVSNWRKWGYVKGVGREIKDTVRRWRRCCRHHRWRRKIMESCNNKDIVLILLGCEYVNLIIFSHSYLVQKNNYKLTVWSFIFPRSWFVFANIPSKHFSAYASGFSSINKTWTSVQAITIITSLSRWSKIVECVFQVLILKAILRICILIGFIGASTFG